MLKKVSSIEKQAKQTLLDYDCVIVSPTRQPYSDSQSDSIQPWTQRFFSDQKQAQTKNQEIGKSTSLYSEGHPTTCTNQRRSSVSQDTTKQQKQPKVQMNANIEAIQVSDIVASMRSRHLILISQNETQIEPKHIAFQTFDKVKQINCDIAKKQSQMYKRRKQLLKHRINNKSNELTISNSGLMVDMQKSRPKSKSYSLQPSKLRSLSQSKDKQEKNSTKFLQRHPNELQKQLKIKITNQFPKLIINKQQLNNKDMSRKHLLDINLYQIKNRHFINALDTNRFSSSNIFQNVNNYVRQKKKGQQHLTLNYSQRRCQNQQSPDSQTSLNHNYNNFINQ